MRTNLQLASIATSPCQMRFVIVNGRAPRANASCALCSTAIGTGYVRVPSTGQFYCDTQCFAGHEKMTLLSIIRNVARKAS
jgi:hypothetical protein